MNVTLDAESEKLIQRAIDLGRYSNPSEVIAHALSLLDAGDDWLLDRRAMKDQLGDGFAQSQCGESFSVEQAREYLAWSREAHAAGQPVGSASDFFRRKASNGASVEEALAILRKAPDVPPMPGDELPKD